MTRKTASAKGSKNTQSLPPGTRQLRIMVNRELYKRNAELAIHNKTLALLRRLDEISMRTLGVQKMTQEMAGAVAEALGFEFVSIATADPNAGVCRWLGAASSLPAITKELRRR